MKIWGKKAAALLLTGALALGAAGCDARVGASDQVSVKVAAASKGKVTANIEITGALAPARTAVVSSKLAGQVAEVDVGDRVQAGQLLVQIDAKELQAQLQQAEAAVLGVEDQAEQARLGMEAGQVSIDTAKIKLEAARKEYERAKTLAEAGAVSQKQLDDARSALDQLQKAYEAAVKQYEVAKKQYEIASGSGLAQARAGTPGLAYSSICSGSGFVARRIFNLAVRGGEHHGDNLAGFKYLPYRSPGGMCPPVVQGLLYGHQEVIGKNAKKDVGPDPVFQVVATNNVHYARQEDFPLHDLLTCARLKLTLEEVHPERPLNDENYLKSPEEMRGLFGFCPRALQNAVEIAGKCEPVLTDEKRHPRYPLPPGRETALFLRELVYRGAERRYGHITWEVKQRLEKELEVINRLGYADYFLVVWDLVNYAREHGIRCSGRGSAGASAVAYCLYLTEVDPVSRNLVFERFLSLERAEKPDIDIDFDSRYRDRVAEYVYRKYGEKHVAAVATYSTYQARSAVRDLGKVLGYDPEEIDRLAKTMPYIPADQIIYALERYPELRRGPWKDGRYRTLFEFCGRIAGFPRFLGTHLGGLVICNNPVTNVTPLQLAAKGVKIAQFDRDDVEDLNLLKLDLLSLKALSMLEECLGSYVMT